MKLADTLQQADRRRFDGRVLVADVVAEWYRTHDIACKGCRQSIRADYTTRGMSFYHPSCAQRFDASHAVAHGGGIPARLRARLAAATANTCCAFCRRRVAPDDRRVRQVGSTHYVFHSACVDTGALHKRIAVAGLRTPAALQRRRAARMALALERARR
jgi:hypothetical protein